MFHPNQHPFVSGFANVQLNHEAKLRAIAAKRNRAYRFTRGTIFIMLMLIFGLGFCIFGWTAANLDAPPKSDIPAWMWTGAFTVTAIGCFISSLYCLFEGLDDLFYAKNDRRRIMKTWSRD